MLSRDRALPLAGITGISLAAWLYVIHLARMPAAQMSGMDVPGMDMPGMAMDMPAMAGGASGLDPRLWALPETIGLFTMWAVMMVAMMLPSATPAILLFNHLARQRHPPAGTRLVVPFGAGYLACWFAFSALAALAQWWLHNAAIRWDVSDRTRVILSGVLLLAAGAYQWAPLKQACLTRCRSPLALFSLRWPDTATGAVTLGLRHGADCVGCCALLMSLLFVGGVMNMVWVAGLAVLVLLEKVLPRGEVFGRLAGLVMLGAGLVLILR